MARWPTTPATDHILLNSMSKDAEVLIRELHDIGTDDAPEALLKLDGLVAIASTWRAFIRRTEGDRLDRIAREERETSVPPAEVA
jgi:hypothetical protein